MEASQYTAQTLKHKRDYETGGLWKREGLTHVQLETQRTEKQAAFKAVTADNSPELMKDKNPQILKAKQILIQKGKMGGRHRLKTESKASVRTEKNRSLQSNDNLADIRL